MDETTRLEAGLRNVLDSHGFSFQYAVLKHLETLQDSGRSPWVLEAVEFPVSTPHGSGRVDFVLRSTRGSLHLVAECKRANPALANWCFVSQPYRARGFPDKRYRVDKVTRESGLVSAGTALGIHSKDLYDLAFELKGTKAGEPHSGGRGVIEDAIKQALLGASGLVRHYHERGAAMSDRESHSFIPAIFTTARLYTSAVPIEEASLADGTLPSDLAMDLKPVKWLLYQYPRSVELSPQLPSWRPMDTDLTAALELDIWRTVAIISPDGISDALAMLAAAVN